MNHKKLKLAEQSFFDRWPGGFSHPEMVEVGKKHKVKKMTETAQDFFPPEAFSRPDILTENMGKIISRSSLISIFEKPKFRDLVKALNTDQKEILADCLKRMLYGDQEKGFTEMADFLRPFKMAKWTIMTICLYYTHPQKEVYVKPTTTKGIIHYFELENLLYKPQPTWAFYEQYRKTINQMKKHVDPSLSPDSAAFTGFLMLNLP